MESDENTFPLGWPGVKRNRFQRSIGLSFALRVLGAAVFAGVFFLTPGGWEKIVVAVVLAAAWVTAGSRKSALRILWHMRGKGYCFLSLRHIAFIKDEAWLLYRLPPYDEMAVTPVWREDTWQSIRRATELYGQIDEEFEIFHEFAKAEATRYQEWQESTGTESEVARRDDGDVGV